MPFILVTVLDDPDASSSPAGTPEFIEAFTLHLPFGEYARTIAPMLASIASEYVPGPSESDDAVSEPEGFEPFRCPCSDPGCPS